MPRTARFFVHAFLAAFIWMSIAPARAGATDVPMPVTLAAVAPDGGDAHGEGDAHHDKHGVIPTALQGATAGIAALLSFGVVFAVLATQVWPRITKGLDERASKIREEIASAERAREQAKDALEEYEKSLATARSEAQSIIDEARSQQERVAADLRAKTEREISNMRERAMREIELARRAAVEELHGEAVALGSSIASRILEREVSADDQDRLLAESLAELQSTGA